MAADVTHQTNGKNVRGRSGVHRVMSLRNIFGLASLQSGISWLAAGVEFSELSKVDASRGGY